MEQNGLYAEEYGENGYMEQEEEWEREGLLDPAWEKQQKKVSESENFLKVDEIQFYCGKIINFLITTSIVCKFIYFFIELKIIEKRIVRKY